VLYTPRYSILQLLHRTFFLWIEHIIVITNILISHFLIKWYVAPFSLVGTKYCITKGVLYL